MIQEKLLVRFRQCSTEFKKKGLRLINSVYGGEESSGLWRYDSKKGVFVKTLLMEELEALCEVWSFGGGGAVDSWVHHCCVLPGSVEASYGMRVGGPCCSTRGERLDKVVNIVLRVATTRAWLSAGCARWTNLGSVLRRWSILMAADNVMYKALRSLKTHLGSQR